LAASAAHPSRPRPGPAANDQQRLRQALLVADGWLDAGLSVQPADETTAEAAVADLYALLGQRKPGFEWVASPAAAQSAAHVAQPGFWPVRLRAASAPATGADWPVAARLASLERDLRERLDARVHRRRDALSAPGQPRPPGESAEDALESGTPLVDVLEVAVRDALRTTLHDGICAPLRTALPSAAGPQSVLAWHGQHDADWVGYYDALRRIGLITLRYPDDHELDLWAALAVATGWWWPGQERCVMARRLTDVHSEPLPGARHGEQRLHRDDGPAIRFADGSGLHVLHGTPVPEWVLTDPSIERIRGEPNVEVRRCAIERLGWASYIRQAGLSLVAVSPDPANPGADLCLYDVPFEAWGAPTRVLLVVNGSAERDGRRRRYGLSVPASIDDPVTAAGWSYGLTGQQYARLARRT
jgi:hypothetical protein